MARARNIKPGLFRDEEMIELPIAARYLFIGLWTMADRRGRLGDRPKKIRIELLPYDDVDVDDMLDALADKGFLIRYGSGADRYIQIRNFEKHQNPHKNEAESDLPAPEDVVPLRERFVPVHEDSRNGDATPADSLIPDSLIADVASAEICADVHDTDEDVQNTTATDIELSTTERRIVSRIKAVRGMAAVADVDIVLHLRDVLSDRGSPIPDDILLSEATRFREHWQANRSNKPIDQTWPSRGWKRAVTNWFSRTRYEPPAEPARQQLREWTADDDPFDSY